MTIFHKNPGLATFEFIIINKIQNLLKKDKIKRKTDKDIIKLEIIMLLIDFNIHFIIIIKINLQRLFIDPKALLREIRDNSIDDNTAVSKPY